METKICEKHGRVIMFKIIEGGEEKLECLECYYETIGHKEPKGNDLAPLFTYKEPE